MEIAPDFTLVPEPPPQEVAISRRIVPEIKMTNLPNRLRVGAMTIIPKIADTAIVHGCGLELRAAVVLDFTVETVSTV